MVLPWLGVGRRIANEVEPGLAVEVKFAVALEVGRSRLSCLALPDVARGSHLRPVLLEVAVIQSGRSSVVLTVVCVAVGLRPYRAA